MHKNGLANFFFLLLACCALSQSVVAQVASQDSLALVAIYNSTGGDNWTNNSNWLTGQPVSDWYGISVTDSNVTKIDLNGNNLTGSIPTEIGDLVELQILRMGNNDLLSGPIPEEIGKCISLYDIKLYNCDLNGEIPASIGNLTNLNTLQVYNNHFSGSIPVEIGDCTNLQWLDLYRNTFSGSIPSEIGNLTELIHLSAFNNQLTGNIPAEIGNLVNLTWLELGKNQLTGTIPDTICSLINLNYLMLYQNQLSGTIPAEIGNLSDMRSLFLHTNQLSGAVPDGIVNMLNLSDLGIENNLLNELPDLSSLTNLSWLVIQDNRFTFEDIEPNIGVPSESFLYAPQDSVGSVLDTTLYTGANLELAVAVGGTANLYQWKKDGADIPGASESTFIISNAGMEDSGVYGCEITNTIATELTLYHRPFVVHVHQSPREADSLALVDFYNNTNGSEWTIKTNWLTTSRLENWHGVTVEDNRVVTLELQENNLNGTIPLSLGDLSGLTFLSLRNNNLSGSLPEEIGNMTEMRELDFAFNNISGKIPETLGNLSKLHALFLDFNALEDSIPEALGNLKNLVAIYLGGNQLIGHIPDTLCTLTKLTIFHFPDNNLTGHVPASLVNLKQLESIELNHNHLVDFPDITANIPPLQTLRIAQNNFVFSDIEPYVDAGLTTLTYGDQDSVHTGIDTTITEGDDLYVTAIVGGSANAYKWYKDGEEIAGAEGSTFSISSAQLTDAGSYHCEITSSLVPGLTLHRRPVVVTVEEAVNIADHESGIPKEFILCQNYPNPFNPHTMIRYALPVDCQVKITVHDILGKRLETLVSEHQRAGYHKIEFDGSHLSSGVYFYKISASNYNQVQKMILMQ